MKYLAFAFMALIAVLVVANNTGELRSFTDWYFASE